MQGVGVCVKRPFQLVTLRTLPEESSIIKEHASLSAALWSFCVRPRKSFRGGAGVQLAGLGNHAIPLWDSVSPYLEERSDKGNR